MVFTERQKRQTIVSQVSQKVVSGIINDKQFMESLAKKVADMVSQNLQEQIGALENKVSAIEAELKTIKSENDVLNNRIDYIEQQAKLNQLRLYGLPETNSDLKSQVCESLKTKLGITDLGIRDCYRIGKKLGTKLKPRAVTIVFTSTQHKSDVFFNKKKFKNSKLVIVEELTRRRYELLGLAKEKFGRNNAWTVDGKIFVKINGNKTGIKTEEDLLKYSDE